jgi:hypothetical protein
VDLDQPGDRARNPHGESAASAARSVRLSGGVEEVFTG